MVGVECVVEIFEVCVVYVMLVVGCVVVYGLVLLLLVE